MTAVRFLVNMITVQQRAEVAQISPGLHCCTHFSA